jgi:hypothetical protein
VFDYISAEVDQPDRLPESSQTRSSDSALTPIMIGMLSAALLGLIGMAALIVWRRVAQSRLTPEVQARELYWAARRSLRQLGVESALSATPAEFRAACIDRLADQPTLRQAVEAATALYIRAVFTSTPPDRSDVDMARRAWRAAWQERLRLRWRKLLPR